MLKDNRFILRAMGADADAGGAVSLHALTIGYVAKLPGPGGSSGGADQVLTVASPDLLAPPPAADARAYQLSYSLRQAERKSLDQELQLPGVIDVPLEA